MPHLKAQRPPLQIELHDVRREGKQEKKKKRLCLSGVNLMRSQILYWAAWLAGSPAWLEGNLKEEIYCYLLFRLVELSNGTDVCAMHCLKRYHLCSVT